MASPRRITIPDIVADPGLVQQLMDGGETLFVEFKETDPKGGLGATVASFANTLGGWLLIGVDDTGNAVGYSPPGRVDLQDYIRQLLGPQIDPLPPFAAVTVQVGSQPIGVVRVAESSDTPHVTSDGIIYLRLPGGKQRVKEARGILELARRGEQARVAASQRQWGLSLITEQMATPPRIFGDEPGREADVEPLLEVIVRASPYTVTGAFADRALSLAAHDEAVRAVTDLFPKPHTPPRDPGVRVDALARGLYAMGAQNGTVALIDLALDAGGTVAVRRAWRRQGGTFATDTAEDLFGELIGAAAITLGSLDGYGRAAVDLEMRGTTDLLVRHGSGQMGTVKRHTLQIGGDLAVPATGEDITELAARWVRELAREAGIPIWEP